jgi:hypothetical protein
VRVCGRCGERVTIRWEELPRPDSPETDAEDWDRGLISFSQRGLRQQARDRQRGRT